MACEAAHRPGKAPVPFNSPVACPSRLVTSEKRTGARGPSNHSTASNKANLGSARPPCGGERQRWVTCHALSGIRMNCRTLLCDVVLSCRARSRAGEWVSRKRRTGAGVPRVLPCRARGRFGARVRRKRLTGACQGFFPDLFFAAAWPRALQCWPHEQRRRGWCGINVAHARPPTDRPPRVLYPVASPMSSPGWVGTN